MGEVEGEETARKKSELLGSRFLEVSVKSLNSSTVFLSKRF